MAFDQAPIGKLTADLMDHLESRYGEDAEIGAAVLIVEVTSGRGSEITSRSTDPRRHVTLGLLEVARNGLIAQ